MNEDLDLKYVLRYYGIKKYIIHKDYGINKIYRIVTKFSKTPKRHLHIEYSRKHCQSRIVSLQMYTPHYEYWCGPIQLFTMYLELFSNTLK